MKKIEEIIFDLIKINSTNPPGNESRVTNYIIKLFEEYPYLELINHGNNRSSLIIDIEGKSNDKVAFIGHIDTVPVSNPEDWVYSPFEGKIIGDLVYGRGASDMKSGIASMLYMGLYFIENKIIPNKSIRLIFTADEESNGMGIKAVVEKGFLNDITYTIVPENTDECLVIKEKGALWIKTIVLGKMAHGARPDLGINAIEKTYELYFLIKEFVNIQQKDNLLGINTVSINRIEGGEKTNIIADYCESEIDIRLNPDVEIDKVLDYLDKQISILEKQEFGLKINYEILNKRPPLEIDEGHKLIQDFKDIIRQYGNEVKVKGVNYFTDLSISMPIVEKPFLIYGPGFEELGHQKDECASIKAIVRVAKVYIDYCLN